MAINTEDIMNREVSKYMAEIGSKGGKSVSKKKRAACRRNAAKARAVRKIWLAVIKKNLENMDEVQRMKALYCKD